MSVRLTDEQRAIREAVREFGEDEIEPIAREYDEERRYPREVIERAAEYGFVAPHIGERYGGAGLDTRSCAVVTEELWRADTGIGRAVAISGVGTGVLQRHGDGSVREEWLPRIAAGEAVSAIAISEPGAGSDVAGMEARAVREDDGWVLDGTKTWITNGTVCDVCVLFARTGEGRRDVSAFLVPADADGLARDRIDNTMGHRAADLGELVLDGVRVPEDHLVGERDAGFDYLLEYLAVGRVDTAAQAVGAGQAALDAALDYAGEREQFDRPIAEFQAIKHKLADMATGVEAARSLTYDAADYVDADHDLAPRFANMAKLFATERAVEVADEAIQVHGGAGYVTDFPVERYYRDVRVTRIYEGTNEIVKNAIAGSLL